MTDAIPATRLAPIIAAYLDGFRDRDRYGIGGYTALAELAAGIGGVSAKTLKRIVNGRQQTVKLGTADVILIALGQEELWHVQPEDGGLADLYEWEGDELAEVVELPPPPLPMQGTLFDLDTFEPVPAVAA